MIGAVNPWRYPSQGRRRRQALWLAPGLALLSLWAAPAASASSPLAFGAAVATEPGGAPGSEPSAVVNADGVRLVTWQGGDPVDRSDDGIAWTRATAGHDSAGCVDAQGTQELFDAGDVNMALDADGHTVYVSSLAFNETDGVGVDIVTGTENAAGTYHWAVTNCHAGEPASDRPWIAAGPHHGDLVLYE